MLIAALSLQDRTLTEEQIETIFNLAEVIRQGLAEGDDDFGTRRAVIEHLQPQVRLVKEDGVKVVYVTCFLGKRRVTLNDMRAGTCGTATSLSTRLHGRSTESSTLNGRCGAIR